MSASSNISDRRAAAFTLTELLVVMAVITVLSVVTLVSIRVIARDARISSSINTVMASLSNARALAMKTNKPVMVAFYPRLEGINKTRVDIITAAWAGDSIVAAINTVSGPSNKVFDRFLPLSNVPIRSFPAGIKIAGPYYSGDSGATGLTLDDQWVVMTELSRPGEAAGMLVGVMYGPDGTTITNNPSNDSDFCWIDLNNSGRLEMDLDQNGVVDPTNPADNVLVPGVPIDIAVFTELRNGNDEVAVNLVPFLAVFDDDESREIYDSTAWVDPALRMQDLTTYITERADRIHFNRYTGVAMK